MPSPSYIPARYHSHSLSIPIQRQNPFRSQSQNQIQIPSLYDEASDDNDTFAEYELDIANEGRMG